VLGHPFGRATRYHIWYTDSVSSADVIRALKRDGWTEARAKGSHHHFQASDEARNRHRPTPEEEHSPWHAREHRASSGRSVEVKTCTTRRS